MNSPAKADEKSLPLAALLLPFKTLKAFKGAFALQKKTIVDFYSRSSRFSDSSCPIGAIPNGMLELKRNVFSTLFLGVTAKIAKSKRYMPLYAMVNQCMRAWVTACDNILDDEYKVIYEFPNAGQGERMRSVLTLMVAERVLSTYVMDTYDDSQLLRTVETRSLQSLLSSAIQECEEEGGDIPILSPEEIISDVHQRKTADLFLAPLALPFELEQPDDSVVADARGALENFALGCQIVDDVKDMSSDVTDHRHNLLVSLLVQDRGLDIVGDLRGDGAAPWDAWDRFPDVTDHALGLSRNYFEAAFRHMSSLGIIVPEKQHKTVMQLICKLLRVPMA
jgi:hypothetical protein